MAIEGLWDCDERFRVTVLRLCLRGDRKREGISDLHLLDQIGLDPHSGITATQDRYGPELLGRLQAHCRYRQYGDANVEDVYQQALLRLIDPHKRDACKAAGGLILPWLLRWGYWRLDDLARRQRQWELRLAPLADQEWRRRLSGGQVEFEPRAAASRVAQALTLLSPRDRDLLQLRYEQRLTEPEIAERMSLSPSVTKKRLHDARARLKKLLADVGLE